MSHQVDPMRQLDVRQFRALGPAENLTRNWRFGQRSAEPIRQRKEGAALAQNQYF